MKYTSINDGIYNTEMYMCVYKLFIKRSFEGSFGVYVGIVGMYYLL